MEKANLGHPKFGSRGRRGMGYKKSRQYAGNYEKEQGISSGPGHFRGLLFFEIGNIDGL